jgi:hypothetical protein
VGSPQDSFKVPPFLQLPTYVRQLFFNDFTQNSMLQADASEADVGIQLFLTFKIFANM